MPDDAPGEHPTVLVIEDDAPIAGLVSDVLADAGYRAVWMPDGRATPGHPDGGSAVRAAVVDLRLAGGRDGRDVLRRLRERRPGMPAVVTTGFDPQAPEADLRGLGGPTLRLGKPFDGDVLLAHLAGVLGGSATPAPPRRRASDARAAAGPGAGPAFL